MGAASAVLQLARFTLGERLGEGGMGQVWRARDPELDRDVAIKVLRPEVATSAHKAAEARARLKREAQAMARLAHPNVIAVHEVGEAADQVFVVMELVNGVTLSVWRTSARRVAEILDVFAQAGRGLAAAHSAGLVHRDFKPDNVLVGNDGRVRVTDFGLVGVGHGEVASAIDFDAIGSLTRTGTILGTPAYLAPEVLRGGAATMRSDQFAFCVALYEALWQQPPFPGETIQQLFASVTSGALVPPPRLPAVPARVRDAIARGLATDPARRWDSMDSLLGELVVRAAGRRPFVVGGIALAAIAGGAAWWIAREPASPAAPQRPPPLPAAIQLTQLGACTEYPTFVDDKTVVFEHSDVTRRDIFKITAAGGAPVQIDPADVDYYAPTTSAPGEVVVTRKLADGTRSLERMRLDGSTTPLGPRPAHSADTRVAIVGDALYYLRRDNGQLRRKRGGLDEEVVNLPGDRRALHLAASPDGRWMMIGTSRTVGYCMVDLAATPPAMRCEADPTMRGAPMMLGDSQHVLTSNADGVWKRRLDGTSSTLVASTGLDALTRTVSADGRTIVYSACVQQSRTTVRDPAGAIRDLAPGRHLELAARTDGGLAMVRYIGLQESLIAVREPSGELREITPRAQLVREPSWSVDGKRIAYRVAGTDGGIYVVDVTPLPPRRVSDQSTDIAPVFLADGRIAVARYGKDQVSRLTVIDPDTGAATQVDERPTWPYDRHPVSGVLLVGDSDRHRLWTWDPKTGAEVEVARGDKRSADAASFARDGKSLLVVWGKELWRLPIGGGEPVLLFTGQAPISSLGRAVELPDGSIAFTQHDRRGELYRLDLP